MNTTPDGATAPAAGLHAFEVAVDVPGKTLLSGASAQFHVGEVTAILGPNGAGKSTFMSVLTGQRQPTLGSVTMGGKLLASCEAAELARARAFVAQETQVAFDFSVREVVDLGRYPHRKTPSPQEGDIVMLAMQATAVDHLEHRALNTLSGGEKARVHLARALAQVWESPLGGACAAPGRPKPAQPARGAESYTPVSERGGHKGHNDRWLLLDEPTAALDLKHQHRMLALARRWATTQQLGVVAVLHDLNLALRYSDRCVVLQNGHVVASGPTAGVLTAECIHAVWDVVAHPVQLPASPGAVASLQYVFEAQA